MKVIETLRRLRAAATGGRWRGSVFLRQRVVKSGREGNWVCKVGEPGDMYADINIADSHHIAAAHNSQEALLKVAEAALGVEDALQEHDWSDYGISDKLSDARDQLRAALAELEALEL